MANLADFILARFAEREDLAAAVDGSRYGGERWRVGDPIQASPDHVHVWGHADSFVLFQVYPDIARYVVANDPEYTLADLNAKRVLLLSHLQEIHRCDGGDFAIVDKDCLVKLALAAPFVGHPEFDPSWRVSDG